MINCLQVSVLLTRLRVHWSTTVTRCRIIVMDSGTVHSGAQTNYTVVSFLLFLSLSVIL